MSRDPILRNNITLAGNPHANRTLLFVHGLGADQSVWNQVAPAFQEDYRLVLIDNVGAVATNQKDFHDHQHRYLHIDGYASDLLEICSALELSSDTILIGHSMGAMAGLLAAVQSPRQFTAALLLGASPRYQNADGYDGGFTKDDIDQTYAALMANYLEWTKTVAQAAMGNADQPGLAQRFAETMARVPREMMLTVLCSVLQADLRSALPKVAIPVLLIQSHQDFFVPSSVAHYMRDQIPGSQLVMIDATGHLPHVSAPDKVVTAIRQFLQSY